jgi:hypothetical protein
MRLRALPRPRRHCQRLENSQLHADLTAARARRAATEKGARDKEAAFAAWIAGLRDELAQSEAQLALTTAARESGARLLEEARAAEASARARWQLALLEDEVERQQSHGDIAQLWLKDWVLGSTAALEDLLLKAGVDIERMMARATSGPTPAQGGPLQGAGPDEVAATAPLSSADPISGNIHRLAALQRVARTLPLAAPLEQFYVTSPHGKRRDPFTKAWAYHAGSISARRATPRSWLRRRVASSSQAGPGRTAK